MRAAAAARLAADFADVPENPLASRADALSCLADALEGRTPETTTWRSSRGAYVECDILAADLSHKRGTPGRGLRSAIPGELASVADLLAFESDLDQQQDGLPGPEACVAVPGRAHWLDVPSDLFADRPATALALGLERTLVDRLAKTPRDCPRLEAMAASAGAFAALSGDYEGARRLVAIQARSPSAIESPITSLPAAVDFLAIGRMPDLGRREQAAWKDGASVVELLEPKAARGAGPWLPMMVSKVTSNQDRVRAWLRWGTHASCWSCQPEAITFDAARRRDAAILIGDPALAAELDATASRFRAALLERRFAVPLAVLSTL